VHSDATPPVDRQDLGMTWNRMGAASRHNTITVRTVFTGR
jgi:hypothetical protein